MWHLKKTQCLIHTVTSAELLFSYSVVSDSLQPHGLQHPRLPCSSPSPGVCSNLRPLSQWAIQWFILCHPLLFLPSVFPSIRVISNELVLGIRWPNYWSFSLSISLSSEYSGLIAFKIDCWSPCCPRDSQESSPAPQFEGISSSVLSLFYCPAFTSIHDHWKKS